MGPGRREKKERRSRFQLDKGGGRGRAGAYSFVACLSHLTIEHASLSRWRTVPTRDKRHLRHLGVHYVFFHMLHRSVLLTSFVSYPLPVSPSVATIYLLG